MRAAFFGLLGAAAIAGLAIAARPGPTVRNTGPAVPPTTAPQDSLAAIVGAQSTAANLQFVFNNEVNAKYRYQAYAKQADAEGYPAVARLFRACAQAEQVHADQHVHAISWIGGEARGTLQRIPMGTTEENLATSLASEVEEADQLYPAMIRRARAEHQSMAVRSANFALAAEREHAVLMAEALASLAPNTAPRPFYVCPVCGNTVTSLSFKKCPNCFTSVKRFQPVS
jgi:rubrerythrin